MKKKLPRVPDLPTATATLDWIEWRNRIIAAAMRERDEKVLAELQRKETKA